MSPNSLHGKEITLEQLEQLREESSKIDIMEAIQFLQSMVGIDILFAGQPMDLLSAYLLVYKDTNGDLTKIIGNQKTAQQRYDDANQNGSD